MYDDSLSVASVVLAGGQGTRLYPITLNHSKPAVSYGGRYRLIDIPISNSINSDIRRIFILAQFLTAELQHHITETYNFDNFSYASIDFLTPEEKPGNIRNWFSGTADAVRQTLHTLLKAPVNYFLILSGDQLYNFDFKQILTFAKEKNADLTVAALPVEESEAKRMGILSIDESGYITDFKEKPQTPEELRAFLLPHSSHRTKILDNKPRYLGSMGIYIFKRHALIEMLEGDTREDFGKHIIPTAIEKGNTAAYVFDGYWEDIGTVRSFYEANLSLTKAYYGLDIYDEKYPIYTRPSYLPGPKIRSAMIIESIICEGSIIDAKEITHSVIGMRSHIRKGTVIRDTVMLGNHFYFSPIHQDRRLYERTGIGENCLIEKAIIDEHVLIGNNVKLINQKNHENYDNGEGVFIRDGIIVVTAGAHIPDGFSL